MRATVQLLSFLYGKPMYVHPISREIREFLPCMLKHWGSTPIVCEKGNVHRHLSAGFRQSYHAVVQGLRQACTAKRI